MTRQIGPSAPADAGSGVPVPDTAPVGSRAVCGRCGGILRRVEGGWGHETNPGPRHHYPRVKPGSIE